MRKIIYMMVLTAFSSAALAEWEVVRTVAEATIYVDPASFHKEGNRAQVWLLIDYKQPQLDTTGKKVLSDKVQYQFDCNAKQYSTIATSAYAGHMASGATVSVNPDPPKLTPVEPGTLDEILWQRACGKTAPK